MITKCGPADPALDKITRITPIIRSPAGRLWSVVKACRLSIPQRPPTSREFRRSALNHRAESSLLFGVPLPGLDDGRYYIADEYVLAFAGTFFTLFLELWNMLKYPVPAAEEIDPELRGQLMRYRNALGTDIPVGAVLTFLRCWTVLYGAVAMEVFGHMRLVLEDPAPMFELTLTDLAGLRYPLPSS